MSLDEITEGLNIDLKKRALKNRVLEYRQKWERGINQVERKPRKCCTLEASRKTLESLKTKLRSQIK